jgi:dephospho-CoA kinase
VLLGKMRSGKDTLAEYAIERYGYKRFAFGDGIRMVAYSLFPEEMSNGKPRALLQGIGQLMRSLDNDVWVKNCFHRISLEKDVTPIITDLRQPNEFIKCKEEDYVTIKVECDEDIQLQRIMKENDSFNLNDLTHETELHIDTYECDYVIRNDKGLESLYEQFDVIMSDMNKLK